jgi:hypothetical protein
LCSYQPARQSRRPKPRRQRRLLTSARTSISLHEESRNEEPDWLGGKAKQEYIMEALDWDAAYDVAVVLGGVILGPAWALRVAQFLRSDGPGATVAVAP